MNFGVVFVLSLVHWSSAAPTGQNFADCGLANLKVSPFGRNYGGVTAKQNAYPWMAYLHLTMGGQLDGYICGGTVISDDPNSPEKYSIILGEHRASMRSGLEAEFGVSQIVRHDEFQEHNLKNDIALLRLDRPIQFTQYVRPICLPEQDFPTDADEEMYYHGSYVSYAGKQCMTLAWGETETKWKSDVLKQQLVRIFPRVLCTLITHHTIGYNATVETSDNRFCAGADLGEETCNTRPGGPLMCQDDLKQYYLHGITSFGPEPCGMPLVPGVYTEVSAYRHWIDENAI